VALMRNRIEANLTINRKSWKKYGNKNQQNNSKESIEQSLSEGETTAQ